MTPKPGSLHADPGSSLLKATHLHEHGGGRLVIPVLICMTLMNGSGGVFTCQRPLSYSSGCQPGVVGRADMRARLRIQGSEMVYSFPAAHDNTDVAVQALLYLVTQLAPSPLAM